MDEIIFEIDELDVTSSPTRTPETAKVAAPVAEAAGDIIVDEDLSPAAKILARPEMPKLKRDDRARLLMQSPTRLYFYWSLGANPYQVLDHAFKDGKESYTLALRLIELDSDVEELQPADVEGSWWFDVRPDAEYRAEVGFYAPSRPFVRVVFSNVVRTPRKGPSTRRATDADWAVSAGKFAEVLDVSGFVEDAQEIAAGNFAEEFSPASAASFLGRSETEFFNIPSGEIRLAVSKLAAGETLESLKWKIGPELFAILQAEFYKFSGLSGKELRHEFGIDDVEFETHDPAVFGASILNFPRRRKVLRRYTPVSSIDLG